MPRILGGLFIKSVDAQSLALYQYYLNQNFHLDFFQNYKMRSSVIKNVSINDFRKSSNEVFITIDVDWAHDAILEYAIDIFERHDLSVTWFLTHKTGLLERIRENPKFELGIHPNFNPLLKGDITNGSSAIEVFCKLLDIAPEAKSFRSHSLLQSSPLLNIAKEIGLTHDANSYIPHSSGIELAPWTHWNGLIRVPHFWEDDVCWQDGFKAPPSALLSSPGLKVFDFHPIHIFLNTDSDQRYSQARSAYHDPEALIGFRNQGYGTKNFLCDLLSMIHE